MGSSFFRDFENQEYGLPGGDLWTNIMEHIFRRRRFGGKSIRVLGNHLADDLNCFNDSGLYAPMPELRAELKRCQFNCANEGTQPKLASTTSESKHILVQHGDDGYNF